MTYRFVGPRGEVGTAPSMEAAREAAVLQAMVNAVEVTQIGFLPVDEITPDLVDQVWPQLEADGWAIGALQ
ncbi:MAG: hypothetical protein AAGF71_04060 [Pseudomonadota bacterium]